MKATTVAFKTSKTVRARTRYSREQCASVKSFKKLRLGQLFEMNRVFVLKVRLNVLTGEAARRLMTTHVMITFHLN